MSPLEEKSIQHVLSLLKSFETHPMYSAVNSALREWKFGPDESKAILDALQKSYAKEAEKINECKPWLEALLTK